MEKYLSITLALTGAITFLSGYSYLSGYYQFYGLSLNELDFGTEQVLTHAFIAAADVVASKYIWFMGVGAVALCCFTAIGLEKFRLKTIIASVFSITLVLFCIFLVMSANSTGKRIASSNEHNLPVFRTNSEVSALIKSVIDTNEITWRLLHAKGSLTILSGTFPPINNKFGEDRWVLRINHKENLVFATYHD